MRRTVLVIYIMIIAIVTGVSFDNAVLAARPEQAKYFVTFERARGEAAKAAITARFGNVVREELEYLDAAHVVLPSVADARALESIPGVKSIVPDTIYIQSAAKPTPEQVIPWGIDRIGADEVWPENTGEGVKVAILDTGINEHPDLASIAGGFNTVGEEPTSDYGDLHGHGTMIGGMIAALDNGYGVVGVAPGALLYAVRFRETLYNIPQLGSLTDLCEGMDWCINGDNGIQIINMSFSVWSVIYVDGEPMKGAPLNDPTFRKLVQQAYNKGIVMVAAATNDNERIDNWDDGDQVLLSHRFPVAYPEIIGVSATGMRTGGNPSDRDFLASFSNYGPVIELAAPGNRIESTNMDGGYSTGSGTSYAAPHVVGVAALVLSELGYGFPQAGAPEKVRARLKATAEWLPGLSPEEQGAGLVNAANALSISAPDVAITGVRVSSQVEQGATVSVEVDVVNENPSGGSFYVTLTDDTDGRAIEDSQLVNGLLSAYTLIFDWDTTGASLGDHTLTSVADPVTGETDMSDNSRSAVATVMEPVIDIAVMAVRSSSPVYVGDTEMVLVDVGNGGSSEKTFDVTLTDDVDGSIGNKPVTLAAGASIAIEFDWDRTEASIGPHILTATHNLTGDSNPENDSASATITVSEKPNNNMYISSIAVTPWTRTRGKKSVFVWATAEVTISAVGGGEIEGATVNGRWSGATSDSDSGTTGSGGTVSLNSSEIKDPQGSLTFTFTVDSVTHNDYLYNADLNIETSDSAGWSGAPAMEYSTALGNAYPNPGNPEIWIPFTLADTRHVVIRIHGMDGRLVRILELGQRAPGAYIKSDKAAYWDGRNEAGEAVASGIYFYSIAAGDYTATRKAIIAK